LMPLVFGVSAAAQAAEWNEWRGPQRNGVVEKSPPLATTWPDEGPRRLWLSEEEIPSGDTPGGYTGGGYGGLAVADGRVYCLFILPRKVPLATRTLTEQKLIGLGWPKVKPPEDLLKKAEQARVSDERQALKDPRELAAWIKEWLETNADTEARRKYGAFVIDRLKRGKAALDLAVLDRLETIKDKPFPNQEALDAWFAENGIEGDLRKVIQSKIPDTETYRDTVIVCMDAATGKTVWKRLFPGGPFLPLYENVPSSGTPCVANGRLYVLGTNVEAFCLDARTGEKFWSAKIGSGRQRDSHCSFIVADGVAAVSAQPLIGFDAETGKEVWTHATFKESWSSPALWLKDGKSYFVFRDGVKVVCLEPRSGTILWSMKDVAPEIIYSGSTPAVEGDGMALGGRTGVRSYKLSLEKAEQLWNVDCPMDYCCSPTIYDGHVYVFGRGGATCINVETSKIAWQDKELKTGSYHSPLVADGKFFTQGFDKKQSGSFGDGSLFMVAASSEKGQVLAQARIRQTLCITPAVADGRIFCRLVKRVACYDLRQ